jgi:predicted SnoaL-like aldol condensation-catalyzing enzyme
MTSRGRECLVVSSVMEREGHRPKEGGEMADLEANKQMVREFYELAFNEKKPEQAVERYVGPRYIQHNPQAPDGTEAFIGFVKAFPEGSVDIRRVVAEGDIVVTHSLLKFSSDDERGTVAADFFRVEDGKVVEHWDVLQPFPEESANEHPMF